MISVAGELSLDLMQRLSASDLEDMLKVYLPSDFHHDEDLKAGTDSNLNCDGLQDCGVESAIHRHKIVDAAVNGTDDESFADR